MAMISVQKANVVLNVDADNKDYYLRLGYNVIDDKGRVIEKPVVNDIVQLQKENAELKAKVSELEAQIIELQEVKKPKKKQ